MVEMIQPMRDVAVSPSAVRVSLIKPVVGETENWHREQFAQTDSSLVIHDDVVDFHF
jgi:hypothetical protein